LLDEVQVWKGILGTELVENLLLMENEVKNIFLFYYADNRHFNTDFLLEILQKIRRDCWVDDDEAYLSKILYNADQWNQTFPNFCCIVAKNFDLLKFLKWFQGSFGSDHLKKLLLIRDVDQESIIFNYFSNDRNSVGSGLEILGYLKDGLCLDRGFLRDQILGANLQDENILKEIFFGSEDLDRFQRLIEEFGIEDAELKASLIGSKTILFSLAQRSKEDQEKYLDFLRRKFGEQILNELITDGSLFAISWQSRRFDDFAGNLLKYFDFIERNFGLGFLKQLVGYKGYNNKTFLFPLNQIADRSLIKILTDLFERFKNDGETLRELLQSVNDDGNSFLMYYFLEPFAPRMLKVSKEFFKLIKDNFGLEFLKKLLLTKNLQSRNFYHVLLANKFVGTKEALELLENLLEVVGNDREFFSDLTRQDGEIAEPIKEFLKNNFKIET
jgi:hypothetical protein